MLYRGFLQNDFSIKNLILKIFVKFIEKNLCRSLIFNKAAVRNICKQLLSEVLSLNEEFDKLQFY